MLKHGSLLGGTLLIAGTAIGGGMLALPVLTSLGGYVPSLLIYFCCWLFMSATGLLFFEVSLWMHRDANIVSMAESTLGKWGKAFAWMLYIFLFYCLIVAYTVGCGSFIIEALGLQQYKFLGPLLFLGIFGPMVILSTRLITTFNGVMVIVMALLYLAIILIAIPHVNVDLLKEKNWSLSLLSLPISFIAFAYQGTVPTLVNYLDHDVKKIRFAIIVGSFIPFLTYVVWQTVILGIIPTYGENGLMTAMANGDNAVEPLHYFINNPWLLTISSLFAFIALLTSFFGVSIGLVDFLADGLKIKKDTKGKIVLSALIFIPPFLITLWKSNLFLDALDLAGGYGSALLLGLLPILMVWRGRYHLQLDSSYRFPGGKPVLILMTTFVLFEVAIQLMITMGYFPIVL